MTADATLTTALDATLHQPVRTQIVAYLVGRGEATFSELKRVLQITDGNLDAHLKKLIAADYLYQRRDETGTRPQSVFSLTPVGLRALQAYTRQLQALLAIGRSDERSAGDPVDGAMSGATATSPDEGFDMKPA